MQIRSVSIAFLPTLCSVVEEAAKKLQHKRKGVKKGKKWVTGQAPWLENKQLGWAIALKWTVSDINIYHSFCDVYSTKPVKPYSFKASYKCYNHKVQETIFKERKR